MTYFLRNCFILLPYNALRLPLLGLPSANVLSDAEDSLSMNTPGHKQFATTHWSIVRAAGHDSSGTASGAMQELCRIYWFPVYAFARRKGHSPSDAEDLTQGFFVHLLESEFVKSADRDRGRFRSFLLKSVANFLNADHRRQTAEKRGGGQTVLSLD